MAYMGGYDEEVYVCRQQRLALRVVPPHHRACRDSEAGAGANNAHRGALSCLWPRDGHRFATREPVCAKISM